MNVDRNMQYRFVDNATISDEIVHSIPKRSPEHVFITLQTHKHTNGNVDSVTFIYTQFVYRFNGQLQSDTV